MKSMTIVTVTPRRRGLGGDGLDLRVVAVDQDDPFALVLRVAAFGLVEGGGDDGGDVVGDRGGQPLAPGLRLPRLLPCPSASRPALSSSSASARGC